jgi:transcription termination/antitermination protein NusG
MPEEQESKIEETKIFALRTTANREEQVADFLSSNVQKKNLPVYSIVRAHGMRGYIFVEAKDRKSAEEGAFRIPYARGILPAEIDMSEIEHMLEKSSQAKMTIEKNDIVEIISGPFKRELAKITRLDKEKEEIVIELLEAAVPIPITTSIDSVKVVRRDKDDDEKEE